MHSQVMGWGFGLGFGMGGKWVAGGKGEAPDEGWQRLVAMHSQANGNDNNI